MVEATTGVDINGEDFNAGTWVGPENTSITDYGKEIFIDPDPNPLDDDISSRVFLSVVLHEVLHGLEFTSNLHFMEINPELDFPPSKFDSPTEKIGNQWFFIGDKAKEIHGGPLPLALTGLMRSLFR